MTTLTPTIPTAAFDAGPCPRRRAAITRAAGIASLGWISQTVVELVTGFDHVTQAFGVTGRVIEALFVVGLVGTALTFEAHRRAAADAPCLRLIADRTASIGFAMVAVAAVATTIAGRDVLGPMFLAGFVTAMVGMLGFAVSELRTPAVSRLAALLPIVGVLAGMALEPRGGGVVIGLAFAAVGALALGRTRIRT